eukprot:7324324-Pyramimonas_sp.AAC.1
MPAPSLMRMLKAAQRPASSHSPSTVRVICSVNFSWSCSWQARAESNREVGSRIGSECASTSTASW